MPLSDLYRRQAALLVRTLPLVATETCFALKGGTAINLFVRDMPRLSVDVDLAYLPVAERISSLEAIDAALMRTSRRIERAIPAAGVTAAPLRDERYANKLIVRADGAQIKIEVTPVLRGCVFESDVRRVSPVVEEQFGFAEMQVVSFADLYAGKIVAALDRQHPRDLFDMRELLRNEGIDSRLRTAFVVYLLSHNRPMADVLAPTRRDISAEFERGFQGLTETPVALEELLAVREDLVAHIVGAMPEEHRRFLLSVKAGEPDWPLLGLPAAETLPAVRWRLDNLARLDRRKRLDLLGRLQDALGLTK